MHFWIDKRSQRCGFNGRYLVPPSISGSHRAHRFLYEAEHPKLMVTPVHRFQSILSGGTGTLRQPRGLGYQSRFPQHCSSAVQNHIPNGNNGRHNVNRSVELLSREESETPRVRAPSSRFKCLVWSFFAIITFFIAGAKYYFRTDNMGLEAIAFCSLLVIITLIGGLISLYEVITRWTNSARRNIQRPANTSNLEQGEVEEERPNQVPNNSSPSNILELPPPPYHVAIMLPTHIDSETLAVIRDSPPPSYDKATT